MPTGGLKVQVFKDDTAIPIENVKVRIQPVGEYSQGSTPMDLTTDSSGLTNVQELNTPPLEHSQNPSDKAPYSLVDLSIEVPGYNTVTIKGAQIYPDRTALQQVNMSEVARDRVTRQDVIIIQPNVLYGNFPPKIIEEEIKPVPKPSGSVVLPQVVVPEFITVHKGMPDDTSAPNITVRYKDYIKCVASAEIYATWPEATIRANVYAIVSFTLNRVYTEWYRGKGKDFTITNTTAFDQAFNYGRNIYDNINRIVDELFATYMKRPDQKQPLFAQYCDGSKSQCPGKMTQWGSKYLGDQGKTPYQILTSFYGNDLNLVTAKQVSGIPLSFPGYALRVGSRGEPVRSIQTYLNAIANNYPQIGKEAVNGVYSTTTSESVKKFQEIFSLPVTGVVEYATWYAISNVYVGVTNLAEYRDLSSFITSNSKQRIFFPPTTSDMHSLGDIPSVTYFDEF